MSEKKIVVIGGMPINTKKIVEMFAREIADSNQNQKRNKSDRKRNKSNRWRQ